MNLPVINFEELNFITILVRSLLAMFIGGLIGFERGIRNQPAGMRTYILVCVTSAMVMMTNQFAAKFYSGIDPTRMGAQVVSGIGFLGAGMILITNRDKVKGLTTAAGLWSAACIGLAIGIGFYEVAWIVGSILLITLAYFQRVKQRIQKNDENQEFYLLAEDVKRFNQALEAIEDHLVTVSSIKSMANQEASLEYLIRLEIPLELDRSTFLAEINELQGIQLIENDSYSAI